MRQRHATKLPLIALALIACPAWTAAGAQSAAESPAEAYGYFRTVEGRSLLSSRQPEETRDLEINLPILAGDAVQVGSGARVEAVLADGSVARLEGGTEIVFDQLARSPDSPGATSTRLVLLTGEMQIRVPDETAEGTPIEIESHNSRVYLIRGGSYWIGTAGGDETRLVVREGSAEVLTEEGSHLVQGGEEIAISGAWGVETRVARAGYERAIERWARDLEHAAYVVDHGPVEQPLRYAAAPLARSGSWVRVDGRVAWRPRVRYGWRPFTDGYWVYTPSGLSWVSTAPWGYVTSHYGSWDYVPSYGWCWFPGSVYSPAWVYWYWGPTHVAWVPYGYYARHYGPHYGWRWAGHGYGLRFGVYGYAAGGWSVFADWTFCPLGYFGRRGGRYHYRSGHELAYAHRALAVPRGVITTDTRGLDRAVWTRPYEARRRLGEIHRSTLAKDRFPAGSDLPDVTSFIARRRDLPSDLRSVVKPLVEGEKRPALGRLAGAVERADAADTRAPDRAAGRIFGSRDGGPGASAPPKPGTGVAAGPERGAGREQVSRSEGLVRGGTSRGDTEERDATRFDRKPAPRPTEFERAPTTVYSPTDRRLPDDDRRLDGKIPSTRPGAEGWSGGSSRGDRPGSFERAPTSVYGRPGDAGRVIPTRPEAAPGESSGGVLDRKPMVDDRTRATSPVYARPGGSVGSRGDGERSWTPATEASPGEPASGSSVSAPAARRVVEGALSRGASGSTGARAPATPPAPTRVAPGRAPSTDSRAQAPPSRSAGSRVQSSGSRSSGTRVQSSAGASSGRRTAPGSRSGSSTRKKDD